MVRKISCRRLGDLYERCVSFRRAQPTDSDRPVTAATNLLPDHLPDHTTRTRHPQCYRRDARSYCGNVEALRCLCQTRRPRVARDV